MIRVKRFLNVLIAAIILAIVVGMMPVFPGQTIVAKAAVCELGAKTLTISASIGVRVRARPTIASSSLQKLTVGSTTTVLEYVVGQKVTYGKVSSTTWAKVQTRECVVGYISMAALGVASVDGQATVVPVSAPTQAMNPNPGGGIQAGGIFASLNVTVYSAKTYTGKPVKVSKLMGLTGRAGTFHGGQYPFEDFLYDSPWSQNGFYYGQIILETSGSPAQKNAYAWKQNGREDFLLVWVYYDMEFTDNQGNICEPGSGNGCGQHHFAWWGAVAKSDWDQATR